MTAFPPSAKASPDSLDRPVSLASARASRPKRPKPRQDVFSFLRRAVESREAVLWPTAKHIRSNGNGSVKRPRPVSFVAPAPISPSRAEIHPETSAAIVLVLQPVGATASAYAGPVPEPPSAEDIFGWVGDNLAQIKGHARKYLAYSPYEMEEFVQQAYETALLAREEAIRKGAAFEKMFWSSFRIACIRMTYTNGEKLEISHGEYQEFWDDDSSALQPPPELLTDGQEMLDAIDAPTAGPGDPLKGLLDEMSPARTKALAAKALDLMTAKERSIWQMHLKGYSRREIAKLIGMTRQGVQKTLKRGLKHARTLAVSVGLRPPTARKLGRPRAVDQAAAQGYLPVIEESFSKCVQA